MFFVTDPSFPAELSLRADPDMFDTSPQAGSSTWGPRAMRHSINNPLLSCKCTCGGACNCHSAGNGPFVAHWALSDAR